MESVPNIQIAERAFLPAATVVVTAKSTLNPSAITQLWLVKNGLVEEDGFAGDAVYAKAGTIVPTKRFLLMALPNMLSLQLARTDDEPAAQATVLMMPKIADLLGGDFGALGINFNVLIHPPEGVPFAEWDYRFAVPPLMHLPGVLDQSPRFGGYFSFNFYQFRAKIDVKPFKVQDSGIEATQPALRVGDETIMATFNFHHDLSAENKMDDIKGCLTRWTDAFHRTLELAISLTKI